jgi:hypothetical protein
MVTEHPAHTACWLRPREHAGAQPDSIRGVTRHWRVLGTSMALREELCRGGNRTALTGPQADLRRPEAALRPVQEPLPPRDGPPEGPFPPRACGPRRGARPSGAHRPRREAGEKISTAGEPRSGCGARLRAERERLRSRAGAAPRGKHTRGAIVSRSYFPERCPVALRILRIFESTTLAFVAVLACATTPSTSPPP